MNSFWGILVSVSCATLHESWAEEKDVKSRTGLKWEWQWLLGQLPQIIFLENVIGAPSEPARVISYVEINLLSFSPVKFIIHPWSEIERSSSQKKKKESGGKMRISEWGLHLTLAKWLIMLFYNSSPFFFFFLFWVN